MSMLMEECDSLALEMQESSFDKGEGGLGAYHDPGRSEEGEGGRVGEEWDEDTWEDKGEADLSALDLDVAGFSQD